MKKLTLSAAAAVALTTTTLALAAPAIGAPTGPGNAQQTINDLEAQGYKVITNKMGNAPLEQSTVIAVRPGRDVTHHVAQPGATGATEVVLYETVYVDIA